MYNGDYIPLDKAVINENVKELEKNRKKVLSKIRFNSGFEDSIIALNFLNELIWTDNVYHVAYNVAYDYLKGALDSMTDDVFYEVLRVVNRWARAFKCAFEHSSSINFSWAFRELLKEVNPLLNE